MGKMAKDKTQGSLERRKLELAKASIPSQIDQQEQHHNEHDHTFHFGLGLWVDVLFLRLLSA
jgi:hypothetical protein